MILERASELASQAGLSGLSIGDLARHLERPKSTVSSHFRSKESLQLAVLQCAAQELIGDVIRPAWLLPDELPRLEGLLARWLAWDGKGCYPGGCLFVAIASEFDDRPGPVREHLVRLYLSWHHLVGDLVKTAVATGTFHPDADRDQFQHDFHGIMLAYHHSCRLLHDPHAERRARLAFAALVQRARSGK